MLHQQEAGFRRLPPLPPQWDSLAHAFLHQARTRPHSLAVIDSFGTKLTYQRLLVASLALANKLDPQLGKQVCIGILLPPSAGAAMSNVALTLLGRVPVNLNYSFTRKLLNDVLIQCGIKTVITSRRFLRKLKLELEEGWIDLDEVKNELSFLDKVKAWAEAEVVPDNLLGHLFHGLSDCSFQRYGYDLVSDQFNSEYHIDDPATVVFTSGSTGLPKGVLLSHRNILCNIHAVRIQGHIAPGEVVLGVIPFFHSFGFTMTLWSPLCLGETVVYHYNPFDAKRIGELAERYDATTLVCTPTMMSTYLRRCDPSEFATVRTCVLGGEKLKAQQRIDIESNLGDKAFEGYGLAETSPVVACNVPGIVELADGRLVPGSVPGTVGLPLPGTHIRISDPLGQPVPPGHSGMIYVKGPQVMVGYLNQPSETAKIMKDGWLKTGDIGCLDENGFLTITGRESQFSKIAGEMVPHLAVEDEIMSVTGASEQTVCVVSMPDDRRGERLLVAYSELGMSPFDVVERLRMQSALSPLWIPDPKDFVPFLKIPTLANGKIDRMRVRETILKDAITSVPDDDALVLQHRST